MYLCVQAVQEEGEAEGVEHREDLGEGVVRGHEVALGQLGEVGRLLGVAQRRTPRKPRPYQHLQVYQSPWQLLVISNDRESETEFVRYLERGHAPICGTVITEHA